MTASNRSLARAFAALALILALASTVKAQSTYTWNDATTDWTASGAWTAAGPTWTDSSRLTDAIAAFSSDSSINNTPTIGANTIYVNGITLDNSGSAWNINGTGTINLGASGLTVSSGGATQSSTIAANVRVTADQTWNIATGNTVTLSGALSGAYGLTKDGAGTLTLSSTGNTFFGGVTVNAGTLSLSGTTAITNALRSNTLTLASGVTFTPGANARFGGLAGAGTISNSSNAVFQTLLADASSSATLASGAWTITGLATQTFTGTTSGISSTVNVYGAWSGTVGSTTNGLTLSGDATLTGTSASVVLRGGTLTVDNSGTNVTNRLRDAGSVSWLGGGVLKYLGQNSSTDITETAGTLGGGNGTLRVDVTHGGGTGKTTIQFSSLSLSSTFRTLTVSSASGSGALDGTGALVKFTTAPSVNQGVIAPGGTGSSALRGNVIVSASGATNFANYDATNGVVAISPTSLSGSFSSTTFDNVEISSAATADTSSAYLGRNTVTIRDGGSLDISGSNHFGAYAYLFTGSGSATISSTGGGKLAGGPDTTTSASTTTQRFFHVSDPAGVISVSASLAGATANLAKSGEGTLALTGTSNQLDFSSFAQQYVLQGALRGTTTALGGGSSSGGAFTRLLLYGGVLEVDGGGSASAVTFSRALLASAGTASGGTLVLGFSSSEPGNGGFSAINAPGGVDVTLVTAIGGSTASTLTWNTSPFVRDGYALLFGSRNADSRITLTNNIQLDSGTVGAYNAREIRVYDNTSSTGDYARHSGVISGSTASDLLKTGAGTLELTGTNTYSGNTIIAEGTLKVSADANLGSTSNAIVFRGGTLQLGASFNPSSSRLVGLMSGGGTIDTNSFDATVASVLAGSGGLTKSGSGTLTLSGTNTYTGGTTINAGTLKISSDANLGGASSAVSIANGGTLKLTGNLSTSRTITVNSGGTFDTNGQTFSTSGTLTNNGTFSGATTVASGATLGGSGTYGAITVSNGGTLSPGNSPGTVTATGPVTFDNGSIFHVEVAGPSSFDKLALGGNTLTINSGALLQVDLSGSGYTSGQGFVIIEDYAGTIDTNSTNLFTKYGTSTLLTNGADVATYGGFNWKVYYNAVSGVDYLNGGGNNMVLVPVPEPGSIMLVCAAAGGLGYAARKRWRRRNEANVAISSLRVPSPPGPGAPGRGERGRGEGDS